MTETRNVHPAAERFFALTPERVLDAVEVGGRRRATGRVMALNSLENRVYEIELETEERLVAKFYRPDRWPRAAILAEHAFLAELAEAELPVVPPIDLGGHAGRGAMAQTLGVLSDDAGDIFYAAFPKVRGRPPEDLDEPRLLQLGRLVARLHHVGARRAEADRPTLTPETYGLASVESLLAGPWLPYELCGRFAEVAHRLVDGCRRVFAKTGEVETIRLHGDCHLGNLLWGNEGPFFVDFDDFLAGPPVQDLWLMAPGHDEEALLQRELLVTGYEQMRKFDRRQLRLVEPLRALRMLRYDAWIGARYKDPAFQRAFPDFEEHSFWQREIGAFEEQLVRVLAQA